MGLLRVILALAVVAAHTNPLLPFNIISGSMAVQTFYIISGFYMSLILQEKYLHSYRLFITNRILRIYPLYLLVLVMTILVYGSFFRLPDVLLLQPLTQNISCTHWLFSAFLIFSNVFILGQDLASWADIRLGRFFLIPQAWTLSLELMFYALAPFFMRMKTTYLAGILIASFSLRLILVSHGFDSDSWAYYFFPTELAFFLLGMFSYKIYARISTRSIPTNFSVATFIFVIALTIFITVIRYIPIVKAVGYFLIVAAGIPFVFYLTKENKFDRWLGEFSYAIYISHILVRTVLADFLSITGKEDPRFGWWVASGSFLLSFVLLHLVIYPIEKFRQQRLVQHKL